MQKNLGGRPSHTCHMLRDHAISRGGLWSTAGKPTRAPLNTGWEKLPRGGTTRTPRTTRNNRNTTKTRTRTRTRTRRRRRPVDFAIINYEYYEAIYFFLFSYFILSNIHLNTYNRSKISKIQK